MANSNAEERVINPPQIESFIASDAEEEELLHDQQLLDAEEEEEDPVAGQLMRIDEHDEAMASLLQTTECENNKMKFRADLAECMLMDERSHSHQLKGQLHHAHRSRREIQSRLLKTSLGVRDTFNDLQRRVTRYPVEEKKTAYLIDRSVVCHMIQDSFDDINEF